MDLIHVPVEQDILEVDFPVQVNTALYLHNQRIYILYALSQVTFIKKAQL
jgi:hypothetical protein